MWWFPLTDFKCCSVTKPCQTLCDPMDCRLRCPSLSPAVCSNSCPLSQWCHPTISSSVTPSPFALNLSQHQGLSQRVSSSHQVANGSALHTSPSNEYSELISFRIDWFDLFAVQETLRSVLQHNLKASFICCSVLIYDPALISKHEYWKNCIFD